MKFPVRTVCVMLAAIGLAASTASAQTTFGRIVGDVRDSSGSSMVGVEVTVTNEGSRETYKQLTTEVGSYGFHTLIPGTYTIAAEQRGFRPVRVQRIVLQVNQTARFDLAMEVGSVTESVNVTASAPCWRPTRRMSGK